MSETSLEPLLWHLLTASPTPAPIDGVDAWWDRHRAATAPFLRPIHRAIAGGFAADRTAYAFASGYQEALRRLLASRGESANRENVSNLVDSENPSPPEVKRALCVTEDGGNHPRAIQTRLVSADDGFALTGSKRYITLGTRAQELIAIASRGVDDSGLNRLVAVRIPADRDGVIIEPMPPIDFVPELPHARVRFRDVAVAADECLSGDGYDRYVKPFRTVEDLYVHAAVWGWTLGVARRGGWPDDAVERIAALLVGLCALDAAPPDSSATHVALAGILARGDELRERFQPLWERVDDVTRERWTRDQPLLWVAGGARRQRREVAWKRLRGDGADDSGERGDNATPPS
jgi:predicted secreted protein